MTSRLVWQKGFDIVADAWFDFLQRQVRMVVLGTGEPAVQEGLRSLEQTRPRPLRHALRLRRGAGPQDHGGLRHLPHALAHRALRAHPDVRAALRHRARRALRRAGSWTRSSPGTRPRARARASASTARTAPASCGPSTRPSSPARTRRAGRGCMSNGMSRDFSWERSARSYVELYERARQMA